MYIILLLYIFVYWSLSYNLSYYLSYNLSYNLSFLILLLDASRLSNLLRQAELVLTPPRH